MNSPLRAVVALPATMLAILSAPSSRLRAQSATVSRDLATAYARTSALADSQSTVDFAEGYIASQIESYIHLPPAIQVIGTVLVGRSSYVLGTSTLAPDSAVRAIGAAYRAEHWDIVSSTTGIIVAPANGPPVVQQGFRPAPSLTSAIYCQDSTEVRASAVHGANATTVRITLTQGANTLCARLPRPSRTPATSRSTSAEQSSLPLLVNPANANQDLQCLNLNPRSNSTSAELLTTMDPAALADHYGKQLEAQGWSAVSVDAPMIRKIWSRRDSTGRTQTATLVVSVPPRAPMCRDASLSISTPAR